MPDIDVNAYIDQLRQALPRVPPIPMRALKSLHKARDYEGMVRLIKRTMNIDVRLVVGWVNSGGPKGMDEAPAWVQMPAKMPPYGTTAFKKMTIKMFLRKSFLEQSTYQKAAIAIAHELSHVVLDSIGHPLRKEEKAVDLTAMILGFSYLYRTAAHTVQQVNYNQMQHNQLGYLSERELGTACRILIPHKLRVRHAALNYLRASIGVLILIGLCIGAWVIEVYPDSPRIRRSPLPNGAIRILPNG
jgi:hypothetical protein